jgi:hypothetical protein
LPRVNNRTGPAVVWFGVAVSTKVPRQIHRNTRTRSGMHLCMLDDQNGQKTMVLPSADKTRLTHFILSKKFSSKWPSLAADGNTIMNLPCLTRAFCQFLFRHSHSSS